MYFSEKKLSDLTLPAGFTVTAHAGAYGTPDNTLTSIQTVLSKKSDIMEMDVSFRPDGTPVIIHAGTPGENDGILLESAFRLIAEHPSMRMNLDLKSVENLPAVDALVRQYGLFDRAFYTGVGEDWASKVRESSAIPYYLNAFPSYGEKRNPVAAARFAQKLKDLGALGLNTHYNSVSPTVVKTVHNCGLLVSLWTANDKCAMLRCLFMGADNITTRRPDRLLLLAAQAGKQV